MGQQRLRIGQNRCHQATWPASSHHRATRLRGRDSVLIEQETPSSRARAAARVSPSAAAMIDPFIKMCHWRANGSGSADPTRPDVVPG